MTFEQACEFFHQHGNVGRSAEDLMKNCPSIKQIDTALNVAVAHGQEVLTAYEAKQTILDHWRTK